MVDNLSYSKEIIRQGILTFTEADILAGTISFDMSFGDITPDRIELDITSNYFDTAVGNPPYAYTIELDSNQFYNTSNPLAYVQWPYSGKQTFVFTNETMKNLNNLVTFRLVFVAPGAIPGTAQIDSIITIKYIKYKYEK